MIVLRGYQAAAMADVRAQMERGHRSVLLVMPTGSGKTVCFSWLAHQVMGKGRRVYIIAHREELLDQISVTLNQFAAPHAFIAARRPVDRAAMVQVASAQTLVRRSHEYPAPDLIVVDEAHHAVTGSTWGKILASWPDAYRLGVTATPQRLSGEGLGETFSAMVQGPTVPDLIASGDLCNYRIFAPPFTAAENVKVLAGDYAKRELEVAVDKPKITGDAVAHYRRLTPGQRAVVFCVSLKHAEHVTQQFAADGWGAAQIDGAMDKKSRRAVVRDFAAGRTLILTSCDVVSEGFDLPAIQVAILLRPTQSLGLFLQQVGRSLRPWQGKEQATILDHAGNTARHGLPDDEREWTLEGRKRRKKGEDDERPINIRMCGSCFAANRAPCVVCFYCGVPFPIVSRSIKVEAGELTEVDPAKRELLRRQARKRQGQAKTLQELIRLGMDRGYKNPGFWARKIIEVRKARN